MAICGYLMPIYDETPIEYTFTVNLTTIDGYTPRNKKCFCYPYNQIKLTVNNGTEIIFRPELFSDLTPNTQTPNYNITVLYNFIYTLNPKICGYMKNYDGLERYQREMAIFADFPQLSYKYETYQNWLALNKNSLTMSFINKGIGMASSLAGSLVTGGLSTALGQSALSAMSPSMGTLGNVALMYEGQNRIMQGASSKISGITGLAGGIDDIVSQVAKIEDMKNQPNKTVGLPQGNEMLFSGSVGIYVSQETCKLEYIHMIDDYFTRFGYQINETFEPSFDNRKSFDYLKTTGINITGKRKNPTSQSDFSRYNIPNEDILELNAMFDNGITIWHNEATYGDYNVDNSPRTAT